MYGGIFTVLNGIGENYILLAVFTRLCFSVKMIKVALFRPHCASKCGAPCSHLGHHPHIRTNRVYRLVMHDRIGYRAIDRSQGHLII